MKRFDGRVAVVTGAGSGIGRATSERLAREGCDVAVVDRNPIGAEETARRVRAAGRRASVHVTDVSNRAQMELLVAEVEKAHGRVEILVNNAGVTVARSFEDHSLEDFEWIVGVNFWGVVYGCKFFLPILRRADEAHIVNVSSMAGLLGLPLQSSYCATKFALRGFTESLSAELAGSTVRATAVFPGSVRSQVLRSSRHAKDGTVERLADLLERYARPPSVVAARIVRAIRRGESQSIVGAEAHVTDWIQRASPRASLALLAWGLATHRYLRGLRRTD